MKNLNRLVLSVTASCAMVLGWFAWGSGAYAGWNPNAVQNELPKVEQTIANFKKSDSGLKTYFEQAYGYAVFPNVVKGAALIGGARGKGLVFEQGRVIGRATLTQGTIGLQLGGQRYAEIIFFKTKEALARFKENKFVFAAEASAIAISDSASANAAYSNDVAVFSMGKKGFMVEAAIGGQKFRFVPQAS
jgi:lipid-binding SYLF domain-containing protein